MIEFLSELFSGDYISAATDLLDTIIPSATDAGVANAGGAGGGNDDDPQRFLGMDWIDVPDFVKLLWRFAINMVVMLIVVRYIYYPVERRKDYLFTYFAISITVFFLCFLLENVKLELGFALGLFAIFGIIRYRTDPIPIKEMTYLFIVIGLSVINALANKKISYAELALTNVAVMACAYGLEHLFLLKHETRKVIIYEKIELIKPEKSAELMADLTERTGLKISRIVIGKIDFLRDTANIQIFFYEDEQSHHYDSYEAPSSND